MNTSHTVTHNHCQCHSCHTHVLCLNKKGSKTRTKLRTNQHELRAQNYRTKVQNEQVNKFLHEVEWKERKSSFLKIKIELNIQNTTQDTHGYYIKSLQRLLVCRNLFMIPYIYMAIFGQRRYRAEYTEWNIRADRILFRILYPRYIFRPRVVVD